MKITESSDPTRVDASDVWWMLTERVAMTTAVCNELDGGDDFGNYRAKALLGHLRRWVLDALGSESAWPNEGLDELEVPEELQAMLNECILGADVCLDLSMYWTADTGTELASDAAKIRKSLAKWRSARATGFTTTADHQVPAPKGKHLYMIEHTDLRLRKVGIAESAWPNEGLDELEVPEELQAMLNECILGADVCLDLSMYWTADTGTELASDAAKIRKSLAKWRSARATGFTTTADHQVPAPKGKHLYMIEHTDLRLRKVGIAESAARLEEWTRRGWTLLETIQYATLAELRAGESVALYRLDQFHARSSTRMMSWFPNLTPDGRTEMFDPTCFHGTLRDLLSTELEAKMQLVNRVAPPWISEPRSEAARQGSPTPGSRPISRVKEGVGNHASGPGSEARPYMTRRTSVAEHVTAEWLAQRTRVDTWKAECFHRAFFHVVETALRDDQVVILPGFAYGPVQLANSIAALEAELHDDSSDLWARPGHEIAGLLGLTGRDSTSIATLTDLMPLIRRQLDVLDCSISDRAFVALIRAAVGEIEAEKEHLTFDLSPVDRESAIEDWVADHLADIGFLMDMPSLGVYRSSTGRSGRQWRFANGRRADLVCRTRHDGDWFPGGTWLVIELKARYGAAVDVDQINEYVELTEDELAAPDEAVLGCLLADGFEPGTLEYIKKADVSIFLQTLTAIGFHDARFADGAVVGLSLSGAGDASFTRTSPTPPDLPA